MKIYEFKWQSDATDWVFAKGINDAKEYYLMQIGRDDLDGCKVNPVPKKEWNNIYIINPDESEPDPDEVEYDEDDYCNGYKIIESFAEYAQKNTTRDIIASTEF